MNPVGKTLDVTDFNKTQNFFGTSILFMYWLHYSHTMYVVRTRSGDNNIEPGPSDRHSSTFNLTVFDQKPQSREAVHEWTLCSN